MNRSASLLALPLLAPCARADGQVDRGGGPLLAFLAILAVLAVAWTIFRLVRHRPSKDPYLIQPGPVLPQLLASPILRRTALGCMIVGVVFAPTHSVFGLTFVAFVLLPWLAWKLILALLKPERRVITFSIAVLWLTTFALIGAYNAYLYQSSRDDAQRVADAIDLYRIQHGHCPPNLDVLGFDRAGLRQQWRLAYFCENDAPLLWYAATWIIFDTYNYDFEHKVWVYQPD